MKNFKKTISIIGMVALLLQQSMIVALAQDISSQSASEVATQAAQEASPSATQSVLGISQSSSTADASNPFQDNEFFTNDNSGGLNVTNTLQTSLNDTSNNSANIKQSTSINSLPKKTYKKNEDVVLTVNNAHAQDITVDVLDRNGKSVGEKVTAEKITTGDSTQVVIHPLEYKFLPGKYTVKVSDSTGKSYTQDFTWGVLAINTDKSIYLPNQKVNFQMAILDETGNMVCDATVTLTIVNPKGVSTTLSTDSKSISSTAQCLSHEVSDTPDYEAFYTTSEVGDYSMSLSATTKNGTYSINDSFSVKDSVPFDITRHAPTRIYPPNYYPVTLSVTANQDFDGVVQDYVPAGFTLTQATSSATPFTVGPTISAPQASSLVPGSLGMPFTGQATVTQGFGVSLTDPQEKALYAKFGLKGHDGVDFDLKKDTPVVAADGGEIILAGDGAYGTTIVIQHSWGRSYYGHLDRILVKVGQHVERGDRIGLSGDTGLSTGAHLHFGIKPNQNDFNNGYYGKIDPTPYFGEPTNGKVLGLTTSSVESGLKIVSFHVHLQKGESINLAYNFQAPMVSPEFYLLGPAQLFDNTGFVFRESRQWEIASDATNTYYMTSTAGSSPYPTSSWTYSTTANASSNVTTFAKNAKSSGVYMFNPGATNTTSLGSTASSLPTTVNNTGWIYTGTNLDGLQTDSGTWTINYKYSVTYSAAPTTKNLWYRVLKVTCSAGSCTSNAVISPTDASAPASSGWSKTAIGTIPSSGTLSSAQSLTFSGATTVFSSGDKLYVEFAIETNTTNNNSGGWKLEANTSSDNIVTSNVSTPPPILNQVHYRWRNDDGSEAAATWRRNEDTSANRIQNANVRLRVEVSNSTGGSSATGTTYRIEYGLMSTTCSAIATWTAIPTTATTEAFQMGNSTYLTDGNATTNVPSGLTDVGSNFVAGQVKDTSDQTTGITLATTDFTEIEYSIQATSNSTAGDTYCFRLTNAGSTTNFSYTSYPQLIVGQAIMDQKHYRFRNDDGGETTTTGNILYFSPVSDLSSAVFTPTGCTSHYDCLNDNASNAASSTTAPTNDGSTTTLAMAAGTERYSLDLSSLPTGYTITAMTVGVYASDTGNPNTNITVGYCQSCGGSDDTMGTAHNINNSAYTLYSDSFGSLSLTGSVGLVMTADSAKAAASTFYIQITYTAPGASWNASEDTAVGGQNVNTDIRLRLEVANTDGVGGNRNFTIQYAPKTGGACSASSYSDVPITATTQPFEMVNSTYFTNHDATTAQLTATGTFAPGEMIQDPSNSTNSITLNGSFYTEVEYALLATNNANGTYCFRLNDSSGPLDTYSVYPEITVTPKPTLDQLLRHGQWFFNSLVQPFTF